MNPIRYRLHALGLIAFGIILSLGSLRAAESPSKRPNIVVILADDLGFEALGCYGGASYKNLGTVRTPNLDTMAANGMRFTSCYATPVCSPARSELLTGKYNFRTGFIDIAGRNGATERLDPQAHPTVAAQLKAAGYVTAIAGKWHLGPPLSAKEIPLTVDQDTDYTHPRECGFDRQWVLAGEHLVLYGKPTPDDYTPAHLQTWVMHFLESRKGQSAPFFLYYPSPIPHVPTLPTPLNPDERRAANSDSALDKNNSDPKNFPFLIEYLDRQVGEVLKKLDELGLRENTLVLFSGDNGTHPSITTVMRDGREIPGGKASMFDTGSHVPLLANWPGVIQAGAVNEALVDFTDILPTCLELAGVNVTGTIDGVSFAPQLEGKPSQPRTWVHTLQVNKYFVRDAAWKLRENGELYNVSDAPYAETLILPAADTAASKAARVRLQAVLDTLHSTQDGAVKNCNLPHRSAVIPFPCPFLAWST
jgi:arylsulfatase A